ncbi:unnamed protein product [Arctogadus glacialis]
MCFFPSWECCAGNNLHHLVIVKAIDWNDCQAHSVLFNGGAYHKLYLASMHHNENASQEQATTSAGQAKSGEGVVKAVKTDYVHDLMRLLMEVFEDPTSFEEEMKTIPIPPDLSAEYTHSQGLPVTSPASIKRWSEAYEVTKWELLPYPLHHT